MQTLFKILEPFWVPWDPSWHTAPAYGLKQLVNTPPIITINGMVQAWVAQNLLNVTF